MIRVHVTRLKDKEGSEGGRGEYWEKNEEVRGYREKSYSQGLAPSSNSSIRTPSRLRSFSSL